LTGVQKKCANPKQYNEPTMDEVAILIEGDGQTIAPRQIAHHQRKVGPLDYISDSHSMYFPLRYPLFFSYGSQQWDNLYKAWTTQGKSLRLPVL
jgi:hypothetical protein